MPWKGVTMNEQRQRFLEDYKLNVYTTTDLADRFGISRRTAHKWIDRFEQSGLSGYHELSRRPHSSPSQTDPAIVQQIVDLRVAHPRWGPAILLDLPRKRRPKAHPPPAPPRRRPPTPHLPTVPPAARILSRNGLVRPRRRHRRAHPGCPKTVPHGPNDIWAADYKGQVRLAHGSYCFPLTVSALASRFLL